MCRRTSERFKIEYFKENIVQDFSTWRNYLHDKDVAIMELWLNGYTYDEIGKEFDLNWNTIKVKIHGKNRFSKDNIIKRIMFYKRKYLEMEC